LEEALSESFYRTELRSDGKKDYICMVEVGGAPCGKVCKAKHGWRIHNTRIHVKDEVDELRRTHR